MASSRIVFFPPSKIEPNRNKISFRFPCNIIIEKKMICGSIKKNINNLPNKKNVTIQVCYSINIAVFCYFQ